MSDPRDRLLEYALQVHFRGPASRDMAPQVRRAWERGVRGSGLEDLETPDPSFDDLEQLQRELPRRRQRWLPWVAATAAAAALLLLAWARFGGDAQPEQEGLAHVDPPTRTDQAPDRPPDVTHPTPEEEGPTQPIEALPEPSPDPLRPVDFEVALARAQGKYEAMVWSQVERPLGPQAIEKLRGDSHAARLALADMLTEEPRLWSQAEGWVRATFQEEPDPWGPPVEEVRAAVLELLAIEGSARAIRLAEDLWPIAPDSFRIEHVVAFAEAGAWVFEREISAMVDEPEAFQSERLLLPAAYLAARGDDRGRQILHDALASPLYTSSGLPRALVAALALEQLGEERWSAVLEESAGWLEKQLDPYEFQSAMRLLAAMQVFDEDLRSGQMSDLSQLSRRVEQRWMRLEKQDLDADAVRAELRRLRGL